MAAAAAVVGGALLRPRPMQQPEPAREEAEVAAA